MPSNGHKIFKDYPQLIELAPGRVNFRAYRDVDVMTAAAAFGECIFAAVGWQK